MATSTACHHASLSAGRSIGSARTRAAATAVTKDALDRERQEVLQEGGEAHLVLPDTAGELVELLGRHPPVLDEMHEEGLRGAPKTRSTNSRTMEPTTWPRGRTA